MIINSFIIKTVYDSDAQAFITAAALTDTTSKNAINTLVIGLKSASLWTKINAIYPMAGSTAASMKFNLKNPLDTDAAFRLMWFGGWTWSSNGAKPGGATNYARTYITPTAIGATNRFAMGIYSRTQDLSINRAWGSLISATNLFASHSFNGANFVLGNVAANLIYPPDPTTRFHMARRTSTTFMEAYRNGVSVGTNTNAVAALPALEMYLGARNQNGIAGTYTTQEIAFAFIAGAAALTDGDATNLTTLVNNYQLALGRNV
jgi:hypothetical protein